MYFTIVSELEETGLQVRRP